VEEGEDRDLAAPEREEEIAAPSWPFVFFFRSPSSSLQSRCRSLVVASFSSTSTSCLPCADPSPSLASPSPHLKKTDSSLLPHP